MAGGGGGGGTTVNTNTQTSGSPWGQIADYLTGNSQTGILGIYPQAQALYRSSAWSPAQNDLNQRQQGILNGPAGLNNPIYNGVQSLASQFAGQAGPWSQIAQNIGNGQYDANITPASMLSPQQARQTQGPLDPTNSLGGFLNGTAGNQYVDANAQALTNMATRNMMQTAFPAIRSGAMQAGQYGGNRQGIAEGTAISQLNTDLAPAIANMYSQARESQLDRSLATGLNLNNQATSTAGQNAQIQLQNNSQAMQNSAQRVNNAQTGLNMNRGALGLAGDSLGLAAGGAQAQQNLYNMAQSTVNEPNAYNWNNLSRYGNMILPYQTNFQNQQQYGTQQQGGGGSGLGQAIGGGLGLLGTIGGAYFGGPFGGMLGGQLGRGLGGMFGGGGGGSGWTF